MSTLGILTKLLVLAFTVEVFKCYGRTHGLTDQLTGVGARDAYAPQNSAQLTPAVDMYERPCIVEDSRNSLRISIAIQCMGSKFPWPTRHDKGGCRCGDTQHMQYKF